MGNQQATGRWNMVALSLIGSPVLLAVIFIAVLLGYRQELVGFSAVAMIIGIWVLASAVCFAALGVPALRTSIKVELMWLSVTIASAVLLWIGSVFYVGSQVPPINDISSDVDNPPQYRQALTRRTADDNPLSPVPSGAFIEQQQAQWPALAPLQLPISASQALQQAEKVARELGWQQIVIDSDQGTLEAVAVTSLFAFKDDIVVRVQSAQLGGTVGSTIDMRSSSRTGRSDFGVNAQRIETFFEALRNQ